MTLDEEKVLDKAEAEHLLQQASIAGRSDSCCSTVSTSGSCTSGTANTSNVPKETRWLSGSAGGHSSSSRVSRLTADWTSMPIASLRRSSIPPQLAKKRVAAGVAAFLLLSIALLLHHHSAALSASSQRAANAALSEESYLSSALYGTSDSDDASDALHTTSEAPLLFMSACPPSKARQNPHNVQPPPDISNEGKTIIATMWSELQRSFDAHAPTVGWRGKITPENALQTRIHHQNVLDRLLPYPAQKLFSGKGIVIMAGARYSGYAATALGMLRESESQLPIEIWAKDEDEEKDGWCEELITEGIACRRLSDYLVTSPASTADSAPPNGYLYKPLAMLFSSFEEILFLDADNFALNNPDSLFESEPYKEHGVILWPDYWRNSGSPWLPYVTGLRDTPSAMFLDEQTVESGQILWNKRRHWKSLLLAVYYNYYTYWYDLINANNAPGWGDKDTFPLALRVCDESFHLTSSVHTAFFTNTTRIAGLLQANPSGTLPDDVKLSEEASATIAHLQSSAVPASSVHGGSSQQVEASWITRPLLFFHACMAKWSQDDLLRTGLDGFLNRWWYYLKSWASYGAATRTARMLVNQDKRIIWEEELNTVFGLDPEPIIWRCLEHTACRSPAWAEKPLCHKVRSHMAKTFDLQTVQVGSETCIVFD